MNEEIERRLKELGRRAGLRDVPPVAVAACLALAAVVIAWAAWNWWPRGGQAPDTEVVVKADERKAELGSQDGSSVASSGAREAVAFVHVVGAVRRPGVYEIPAGARVAAALDAAGGALPDAVLAAVNLARPISDGEQIVVPSEDDVTSGVGAGAAVAGAAAPGAGPVTRPGAPIDLNTADAAALDALPGIGPSTAAKIVADRDANGSYLSVEDLGRVSGIGPKKLDALKGLVVVR